MEKTNRPEDSLNINTECVRACSAVCDSLWPHGLNLHHLCLLHWQADPLPLSRLGSSQNMNMFNAFIETKEGVESVIEEQDT